MTRFGVGLLPGERFTATIEAAKIAEDAGFEVVWIPDERFFREVYSTMTACALNTKKIKLGTAVTDPYTRNPALTAVAISTVDEISGGRAILGIGAGTAGFKQLFIERKKPIVALREAVQVIRDMVAGKAAKLDGQMVKVDGAKLDFEARKDIPIYIGGHGPNLIELAGEVADGSILGGGRGSSKVGLEFAIQRLKAGAKKSKRDFDKLDIMSWVGTSVSEDSDKARDRLRGFVGVIIWVTDTPVLETLGVSKDVAETVKKELTASGYNTGDLYGANPAVMKKLRPIITDDLVELLTMGGSPSDCIKKIKDLTQAGSKLVSILPFEPEGMGRTEMVRLFAKEVVPAFK